MRSTIEKLQQSFKQTFTHLHNNPEISWEEFETTNYIKSLFADKDCKITTFADEPGLVIEVGQGSPVVALRADIDALWQEVDGTFQANHSCGHDAHMTIVIGTILTMLEIGLPESGRFKFIFQPAEETGTGALRMIEHGVVDDVDFLYGMHLRPIEELPFGKFAPAIEHGAAKSIIGTIIGEDAHGARPHLNSNAIQVGTDFFQKLSDINKNPMIPYSAKMTAFQAGGKSTNIIPGNGTFSIDLRAQENDLMDSLTERVKKISASLADYYDVKIDLDIEAGIAAAVTNDEAIANVKQAIVNRFGEEKLAENVVTTGGDDFHFYTIKNPQIKATMLAIGCDLAPGLHHPKMSFNHEAIPQAIEVLVETLQNTAKGKQ